MRKMHPLRLQYEAFSTSNPVMRTLHSSADDAHKSRQQVSTDNPLWQAQEQASEFIKTSLDAYRDLRDHMYEATVPRRLWLADAAGHGRAQGLRRDPYAKDPAKMRSAARWSRSGLES